jgi:CheY-like chemotaxis protein
VYLDGVYAAQRGTRIPAGPYVMLAVSDSGIGMTADVQARLFEPFFTTKEIGKGTGLGLATVYGIVKQSGGFVWVYSELGIGSAFKVYLPRTEAGAETERAVLTETPTAGGSETILLVEDEESLRKVASEYLRSKGYTVVEAVSGDEALQVCHARAQTIDVLVADMVMPGRRGPEVAAAALAVYPRLRVIYMSGYTDHAIDAALLGTNAVFLQKPFSLDALGRTVRGLLDGPRES